MVSSSEDNRRLSLIWGPTWSLWMRRRLVCPWLRVCAKDGTKKTSIRSALKFLVVCLCCQSSPTSQCRARTVKILLYSPAHICLRTARKEEEEELTAKVASKLRPAFQVSPGLWIWLVAFCTPPAAYTLTQSLKAYLQHWTTYKMNSVQSTYISKTRKSIHTSNNI